MTRRISSVEREKKRNEKKKKPQDHQRNLKKISFAQQATRPRTRCQELPRVLITKRPDRFHAKAQSNAEKHAYKTLNWVHLLRTYVPHKAPEVLTLPTEPNQGHVLHY